MPDKKLFILLITIISFLSCEKGINFKLDQTPSQLVVDASIENDKAPVVVLSNSLNYFSKISPAILDSSFVHDAIVTVSNGNKTQQLKEFSLPADSLGDIIYYYSSDPSSPQTFFQGEFNKNYTLTIQSNGKKYISTTAITSLAKKIDSLWWMKSPDNNDSNEVILMAKITDPPGYGNYIRYFTSVNGGQLFPALNSVYDDQITDGTTYNIQIENGVNRNQNIDLTNYSFFHHGDTATVKFCNIDKATYDFWRTMEYNYQSIGNPFSTPTQVLGNISNGALGYFGGYAAQYISLIIPK